MLAAHMGNGTLHAREKRGISQPVPLGLSRAECTDFPSPLLPKSISLCTVPWTRRPPLVPKFSLLSPLGEQQKNGLCGPACFKNGRAQKRLLRQFSLRSTLKLYPGITYTMRVEEGWPFLNSVFFVNRVFLHPKRLEKGDCCSYVHSTA